MPHSHTSVVHGVLCTTPARTVVDLSGRTPFRHGVTAADSAVHAELTTHQQLVAMLADCHRQPGIANARRVAAFADGRSESPLESVARVLFAERGIEPPPPRVWLDDQYGNKQTESRSTSSSRICPLISCAVTRACGRAALVAR